MAVRAIHTPPLLLCTVALLLLLTGGLVSPSTAELSLDTVRDFLTREEDTIVFSLIERAKYPLNRPAYEPLHFGDGAAHRLNASFAELFIRESEAVQSKVLQFRRRIPLPARVVFFSFGSGRIQHSFSALISCSPALSASACCAWPAIY